MKPLTKAACRKKIAEYARLSVMLKCNGWLEEGMACDTLRKMYERALAELDGLGNLPSKLEQIA